LITTHLRLRDVPAALSTEKIIRGGKILAAALKKQFNIANPRIAVAALNPHAGEDGLLGDEEKMIIQPAFEALGDNFSLPLPADGMFAKDYDAYLCMFHDQALIPIKMMPEAAVNITLGLPIIRTSPDHGTAFDIAGKNIASPDSLIAAIKLAESLV
jgi:4-hydroxythreonine-4-phosphate dehydrogenase